MLRRLVFAVLALAALPAASATATEILPIDEVRPGQRGVGRTVFAGTHIEEFAVEIIGVLENIAPRQSIVLARLSGGPLAETGVIAGMSGSPVFIEGRLLGAVAYGFPFSKETIAGITPIAEMIEATRTTAPRAASARFPLAWHASGPIVPLDRDAFVAALTRPLPSFRPADGILPRGLGGASMAPLALPLTFNGFSAEAFDWARGLFGGMGFAPVMGTGGAGLPKEPLPDLQPGAAVGVSLIEGDLDLSVTGTVTYIDGDRLYAFGHPFYNLGPTQFPLKKAYVFSVFPSLYQSWKISTAAEPVGTVDQDRTTAISGRLGRAPRMIPVSVTLTTSRGQQRAFSFRIVEDELFTPALAYVSLLSVLQSNERAFGTSSIRVEGRLRLANGPDVTVEDLFASNQPAAQAAGLVAAPLAYLLGNDRERVTLEGLDVRIVSDETVQTASLERAWLERAGPVRPGARVNLRVQLRTWRGETRSETIPVTVPDNAPPGRYTLLVADGPAVASLEQRELGRPFVPRDLRQMVRAINGLRRNNRLYVRLLRSEPGALVAGEFLPSLPPSVMAVLGANEGGDVTRLRTSALWDFELATDYAVSGVRQLPLEVER